jgi:SsrA-binding protein
MSQLATNKKASFDYQVLEKYEAGLVLFGYEAKAIRDGQVSLRGSFISVRRVKGRPEIYLIGCRISLYKHAGNMPDYNPTRDRKLLLNRKEINYLLGKRQVEGLTLVPLKIYTNHSFLKLEFAVAKGKKKFDKRETIKKREVERNLRSLTKRR